MLRSSPLFLSPSWAYPIGPNFNSPIGGLESIVPFVAGINPWRPPTTDVTGNADAAPWIKRFQGPVQGEPDPLGFQTGIGILERINLGQQGVAGSHWRRWVERILSAGWEWQSGSIRVNGNAALTFPGVLSDPDNDGLSDLITFTFRGLDENVGNFIAIEKVVMCADRNGCPNRAQGTIVAVAEWPVVPEPSTIALLALGLSMLPLVLSRRGRSSKR